ncbi:MAG: AAA family ATPase [Sphingomonas sp.]|jgi:predicted ATPase|uniref:AAA family ATPase n=1 Tax=Sphingomonas sp. TaxID=28214 RepID=UPI00356A9652
MRLLRLRIIEYKNLKDVEVVFDRESLSTVIIGQNGSGKSYLIEAIVMIFRNVDLYAAPPFDFELDYVIGGIEVRLASDSNIWSMTVNGEIIGRTNFRDRRAELLPDTVFAYYSGQNNRLEALFDGHQQRYYSDLINDDFDDRFKSVSIANRRLFYARPIHGVLAVIALMVGADEKTKKLLAETVGITGFHSAMLLLRKPWFAKGAAAKEPGRFWGAKGRPGRAARLARKHAFFPMAITEPARNDYRSQGKPESQYAIYIRNQEALEAFAAEFQNDLELFEELESIDISDLYRWVQLWVSRTNVEDGTVSYGTLSEGERQFLMVLSLVRLSRKNRVLFLLDEPDTHLNPVWQLKYLELIEQWAGLAADQEKCQIIMTSHNPLTIAALTKKEVRVMQVLHNGKVQISAPYADPRGMGFTSTLTEIFGLPTTLDRETQKQIDERNRLARIEERSEKQERMLIELNDKLDRLGFMHESRDPLYDDFLKAVHDVKYADRPPLTQEQIEKRRLAMQALIKSLTEERGAAH